MQSIYHEQQEGQLCAQHCLNALLQGPYYTAVDLASLGAQLDEEERSHIESATGAGASHNMDDSGFFSLQVLSRALQVWGLEITSFTSTDSASAQAYPTRQKGYICNFEKHWLTIRKLGNQWFNLNSLLAYPELLSDTYLSEFLGQLQREGYSIFVVSGEFPYSAADDVLKSCRAEQDQPPPLLTDSQSDLNPRSSDEEMQLEKALQISRESANNQVSDTDLDLAIQLSQQTSESECDLDLALKLSEAAFLKEMEKSTASSNVPSSNMSKESPQKRPEVTRPSHGDNSDKKGAGHSSVHLPTQRREPINPTEGQKLGGQESNAAAADVRELRLRRLAFLEKQAKAQEENT